MKKLIFALALVLGLNLVTPLSFSYAQEDPENPAPEQPKPQEPKPESE